jgi:hypothetical protein
MIIFFYINIPGVLYGLFSLFILCDYCSLCVQIILTLVCSFKSSNTFQCSFCLPYMNNVPYCNPRCVKLHIPVLSYSSNVGCVRSKFDIVSVVLKTVFMLVSMSIFVIFLTISVICESY